MPARPGNIASTEDEQADLERLAAELSTRGCKTVLVAQDGRPAHLDVLNPDAPALTGRVYAQADNYWWAWAQVIASRDQPAVAAAAIARALLTAGTRP